jgi:cell division protein FtsW (lipid II flippase)
LVYGAAVLALVLTGSFVELAKISVLARLLIYLAVVLAAWRLPPGSMRLPGAVWLRLLAIAVCAALLLQVDAATFARTAAALGIGMLLYAGAKWRSRAVEPSS